MFQQLKRKCSCFFFVAFAFTCATQKVVAQLYNDGGLIKISNGGTIFSVGAVTNATGGIFTNDGKLEVQGNFINSGTYNSTANEDSLQLTGTAATTLNMGSSTVYNLQVNKTGTGGVTLLASATVGTKFDFIAGLFSTDPANSFELVAPATAVFAFAANTQIIGKVRRTGWVNNSTVLFHQANMAVRTAGGTAPTSILVNMVPGGDPSGAEREVKRYFFFTTTGGTGYTADVTFPYVATELNTNTEANLVPWYNAATAEWNGKLAGNTINTASGFVASTGIPAAAFANTEWKLADPRYTFTLTAQLAGPWNGTTMNTAFNNAGLLPLAQPFNTTPFNYSGTEAVAAIPNANIVDWVLVELRKPLSGLPADAASSTLVGRKAAFLLNSGAVVDLDGVTVPSFDISKQGTAFIVVRHLNHLGVMSTAKASNAAGTFVNDFSVLANNYKDPAASSNPVVLLSGTKYGLWPGDANKNNVVNATDISAIKSAIAASASGYMLTDVNLSNSINATDVSVTKNTIAVSGSGSVNARLSTGTIKGSVPE